jgi:predicted nucleic acid-binding protein
MAFVVDSSVTACWAFSDESNADAILALQRIRGEQALVPSLWWFEMRNVLMVNERRGRLTEWSTATFLRKLARLPITIEPLPDSSAVIALSRAHRLTVYDASYLELAQRQGIPLATLDSDLIRAARAEGVPLVQAKTRGARR